MELYVIFPTNCSIGKTAPDNATIFQKYSVLAPSSSNSNMFHLASAIMAYLNHNKSGVIEY